jgi:hypothetical protein
MHVNGHRGMLFCKLAVCIRASVPSFTTAVLTTLVALVAKPGQTCWAHSVCVVVPNDWSLRVDRAPLLQVVLYRQQWSISHGVLPTGLEA